MSDKRLATIINKSNKRHDKMHYILNNVSVPHNLKCHGNCVSTYTSDTHIKRYLAKQKYKQASGNLFDTPPPPPPVKRLLRSEDTQLTWKTHCFFCVDTCSILADPKNPNRWRESYKCHTSDRGTELSTFKDAVLKVCDERGDAWAEQVRVRLSDTRCSFDLHTADARYHEDCRKNFMGARNVSSAKKKTTSVIDRALD